MGIKAVGSLDSVTRFFFFFPLFFHLREFSFSNRAKASNMDAPLSKIFAMVLCWWSYQRVDGHRCHFHTNQECPAFLLNKKDCQEVWNPPCYRCKTCAADLGERCSWALPSYPWASYPRCKDGLHCEKGGFDRSGICRERRMLKMKKFISNRR